MEALIFMSVYLFWLFAMWIIIDWLIKKKRK